MRDNSKPSDKHSEQDRLIQDIQATAKTPKEKEIADALVSAHQAFQSGNSKGVVENLGKLVDFENRNN